MMIGFFLFSLSVIGMRFFVVVCMMWCVIDVLLVKIR